MTTIYQPEILADLKDHYLFLDTGIFIAASKTTSLAEFLVKLKNEAGCSFTTIPQVLFEFTNGSDSLDSYNKKAGFLKSIVDNIDPLTFLNNIPDFYVVMAKYNAQNDSQTDFTLAACLYNYHRGVKVGLLSSDLKAYPTFIQRSHILTVEQDDRSKTIKNLVVYKFDRNAYARAAQRTLGRTS